MRRYSAYIEIHFDDERRYVVNRRNGGAPKQLFRLRFIHVLLLWTLFGLKCSRVSSLFRNDDNIIKFWRRDSFVDGANWKQRQLQSTSPVSSPTTGYAARRINAGGESEYIDTKGVSWGADEWYGGKGRRITPSECNADIINTTDDILYCSNRFYPSTLFDPPFQYTIPLPYDAWYEIRLHFAEVSFNAVGSRVFNIRIEGVLVVKDLDVYAQAGALTAYVITKKVLVTDRTVNIQFIPVVNDPFISAIEVFEVANATQPISAPTPAPTLISLQNVTFTEVIRLNAGGETLVDSLNNTWAGDAYFQGNSVVGDKACTRDFVNTTDDALFCTERFFKGNNTLPFTYEIPVNTTADYQVRLYFSENHFNESGKRLFDVIVEDVLVMENLDILLLAGGSVTPYVISFVANVADAFLSVEFIPKINNPTISAIEVAMVIDTGNTTLIVSAAPSSSPILDISGQAVAECSVYPVCVIAGYTGSCCPVANGTKRECCSGILPLSPSPSSPQSDVPSVFFSSFPSIIPTIAESFIPTELDIAEETKPLSITITTPSAPYSSAFKFNKTLISVSATKMVLGRDRQILQESLALDSNCTEIWQMAIQERIQSETVAIIPMYESINVSLFDISISSDISFLSIVFDTVIEVRSAVQDFDANRFIEGPFDSQNEKVSFIKYLTTTSCPEFEYITSVVIITSGENGTSMEASKSNEEDQTFVWLLIAVGVGSGTIVLVTITIGFARMRQRRKIAEIENASMKPGGIKEHRIESTTPSEINGSQDSTDISTLGDPIIPGILVKNAISNGDTSTVGSGCEDYDYKKAYLDLESVSESVNSHPRIAVTPDDMNSVNDIVSASGESVCDIFIPETEYSVSAPPGMLGLILESSIVDGKPVVNSIKPFSALANRVMVGDRLISVNDENVSAMTASKVSQMIAFNQNRIRILTFKRRIVNFSNGVC